MIFLDVERRECLKNMFAACEDSCILSALSGMNGEAYVDNPNSPSVAIINVADYSFIAGDGSEEKALEAVRFIDTIHKDPWDYNIRCVNKEYESYVREVYKERVYKYSRFATVRSFENMDFTILTNAVEEKRKDFELKLIDEKLFNECKKTEWMNDFVIGYRSYEEWEKTGLGVLFLKDGDPVSGASSYSAFPGGIEVEIITREDYRKQGLAFAAGAALIIECKKRNLVASWDAAHEKSLALAKRLGYKFLYEYGIFGIKPLQN